MNDEDRCEFCARGPHVVVTGDEARFLLAFRRAKDAGQGLDRDVLEQMRALLGERFSPGCSPKELTAIPPGESISPGCALNISTDA